ncbi:MAG: hypothetical protein VX519_08625 [Myxococcota bacterium]|nr:hypothetical protein [Myxococcota bacterium]
MTNLFRVAVVCALCSLWGTGTAYAECEAGFDGDELFSNYEEMFLALRSNDEQAFMEASAVMAKGLPCLSEPVQPRMLAAAFRMLGVRQYRMSDNDGAVRWMRTAREVDPAFEWSISTLGLDAPERALYAQQQLYENADPVAVPGKMFSRPPGTRILLDGRELKSPEATGDRFHLLQVVDLKGPVRSSTVILGNSFPGDLLKAKTQTDSVVPVVEADSSQSSSSLSSSTDVVRIQRQRPPLKTPILGVGGVGLAGAIGLYAMSHGARADFEEADTLALMADTRDRTNGLFLGSCGLLVVGVATTSLGLYMADGPGLNWTWDW